MIQNKTIHYWKLGRDELLLARRNPEIKKKSSSCNPYTVDYRAIQLSTTLLTTNTQQIYTSIFLIYYNLTNVQINNIYNNIKQIKRHIIEIIGLHIKKEIHRKNNNV